MRVMGCRCMLVRMCKGVGHSPRPSKMEMCGLTSSDTARRGRGAPLRWTQQTERGGWGSGMVAIKSAQQLE